MTNRIYLNQIISQSKTNILTTPSFHIVIFDKKNYNELRSCPEVSENGIYILYNHNKYYIGQNSSSKGLISRLDNHYKNKDWWTKGLFFAPKNGTFISKFTKAHYDYLEKTLIKRFEQNHLNLDNKNSGNTSPISEEDKQACELFLSNVIITLENIFNIKLFSLNYVTYLENIVNKLLDNTFDE